MTILKWKKITLFTSKKSFYFIYVSIGLLIGSLIYTMNAYADSSNLFTGCIQDNGGLFYNIKLGTAPTSPCSSGDTQVSADNGDITGVIAGEGLFGGGNVGNITLSLEDNGVTTDKIASGSVTLTKLATDATPKFFTLSIPSTITTTSSASANFGTIDLPVKSNICVMSSLYLANNSSATGLGAKFVLDGDSYSTFDDIVPMSSQGIAFNFAKNNCFPNVSAGEHTFIINIVQFPFRTGDQIVIAVGSKMWITAYPIAEE